MAKNKGKGKGKGKGGKGFKKQIIIKTYNYIF